MQKNYKTISIKKVSLFLSMLLLLFCQFSCSLLNPKEKGVFKRSITKAKVYFVKSTGKDDISLVPITRRISSDDSPIDATLGELFLGPTKKEQLKGLMSEIPEGTRLIKSEVSEDEIVVDLSSQFVTGGGSAAVQLKYLQLYKTLNDIAPDKKIFLHVDGKPIKTIGGEGLEVTQPIMIINDYTEKYEKTENLQP